MLLQRTFEERTWALYRQGRISGSMYDGLGQEAVAAAAGLALEDGDVVAPLNRELATHFARGVTVADAFRNFLGRGDGPTFGRDGNMHFGVPARGVFPLYLLRQVLLDPGNGPVHALLPVYPVASPPTHYSTQPWRSAPDYSCPRELG